MTDLNEYDISMTCTADGAHSIVHVSGEVDCDNAHEIHVVVSVIAGWEEIRRVTIDLSNVSFMDSAGVGALMLCRRHLQAAGVDLDVIGAHGQTLRVLQITAVLNLLATAPAAAATAHHPTALAGGGD